VLNNGVSNTCSLGIANNRWSVLATGISACDTSNYDSGDGFELSGSRQTTRQTKVDGRRQGLYARIFIAD